MKPISVTINQKAFMWNAIGNIMMSCLSFIFSIAITQIQGIEELGIYSIAYAVVNLLYTVGIYNMRTYQVTDRSNRYSFVDYLYARITTTTVMGVLACVVCIVREYNMLMCMTVFLLLIFQTVEAFADVYHGMLQVQGQLEITGKCRTIRALVCGVAFIVVLSISHHLVITFGILALLNIFMFVVLDIKAVRMYRSNLTQPSMKKIGELLYKCTPLFLSAFCSMYYLNGAKYAIDRHLSLELQGIYNILYMPTFVLNLCTGFIIQPLLPLLAQKWEEQQKEAFKKLVHQVIVGLIGMIIIVVVSGYYIGFPVLAYLYQVDLNNYQNQFLILLVAGGLTAIGNILQVVLTVIRDQKKILISNIIGCLFMLGASDYLIKKNGFDGAIWMNVYLESLLCVILYSIFYKAIKKKSI